MADISGKHIFGAGRFFGVNNVTNPTPARFLTPQDMSVTFKRSTKSLFGENQLAADVASGEMTVTGKVTYGSSNPRIFADLMFGDSGAAGQDFEVDNELGTLATHAYTVVNAANTPLTDLGVVNTTNGKRYVRVAAASEAAGISYSFVASTGIYTFNASETGTTFKFSYKETIPSSGESITLTNQPMGRVGGFTGIYVFPWTDKSNVIEQDVLTLNNCIASDSEIGTKMGDFAKPTFSFEAATDANDVLGTFSFAQAG